MVILYCSTKYASIYESGKRNSVELNVDICSGEEMEKRFLSGLPKNAAVICFHDLISKWTPKGYEKLDYSGQYNSVFYIGAHDIDIDSLEEYRLTLETYSPKAGDLARFIYNAVNDRCRIICRCEYGQSRSATCAAAILEHFEKNGGSVFADYRYYSNKLIYNKTIDALKAYKKEMKK